jgi:hypothetical protein
LKTDLAFFRSFENDKTPFSLFLEMHSIFSLSQFFITRVFHLQVCNLKWTQILENENWKCFYKVNMPLNVFACDFFLPGVWFRSPLPKLLALWCYSPIWSFNLVYMSIHGYWILFLVKISNQVPCDLQIALSLLLGSDYYPGVHGLGPVSS